MAWTFDRKSGRLLNPADFQIGTGYSGNGDGLNNPEAEEIHDVGPIPAGEWTIGPDFEDPEKGPCVMRLTPEPGTETFGRSGFLIHGDNPKRNFSASEGCIILGPQYRQEIAASQDRLLKVV